MKFVENTDPDRQRLVGTVIDAGRRKPVPRTLAQAFPLSEGYRDAVGRLSGSGALIPGVMPRRGLRAWLTADRVSWLVIIGLACWVVRWACLAPKGPM